ncbi:MAG TPA: terminase gpA endonuclease subunit, partial [Kiloniellaceae bacterium]|nr:terminase gpA endonuclease subunit [Kiloniellaceae bacterium]
MTDLVLQWATRLGKTFFGEACTEFYADVSPGPQMFAAPDEKLAKEVLGRTVKMIEHCPRLSGQLLPEHRRSADSIELSHCRVFLAWSRSVSTLADKPVRFGHAAEVDKWVQLMTSMEADPEKLFDDRFKEFSRFKRLKESTPTIRGRSRIEKARKRSTNCSFYVPCPHCSHYQTLRMGNAGEHGRLEWDKTEDGRHDPDLARATAHYRCEACEGEIRDHHRAQMLRRGVWAPEGCGVDSKKAAAAAKRWQEQLNAADWYGDLLSKAKGDDGEPLWRGWKAADWITGTPARDGRTAGYHLSSLYATSLTWGDIAAEFVNSKDSPQLLRNFRNQWLAETWEMVKRRHTWEELGGRLAADYDRGVVPAAAWFLTAGVDVQEDRAYWIVRAWGERKTSWLIDWGMVRKSVNEQGQPGLNSDLKQLVPVLIERAWPVDGQTAEGFDKLWAAIVAVDTGHRIHDVHQWMRDVANPR